MDIYMDIYKVYKIRDGVDLYLNNEELLTIYFMNTRLRKQFKVSDIIIKIIESIDGEKNIQEIYYYLEKKLNKKINFESFVKVFKKLEELNVIIEKSQLQSKNDISRYGRQINYFSDFIKNGTNPLDMQNNISKSKILIFGCGAIGGNIAILLAMCGVKQFILLDYDIVEKSDIARHMYYEEKYIGMKKVKALANYLKSINKNIKVETIDDVLTPNKNIKELIDRSSFVVNTADEPYIGYTSMKISRYCTRNKKAHFIAGGFDAHLASTGELIIPGITPCVDCYADYFQEALKGWKPEKHPVKERYLEIGGMSCLSLFSASYAVIEIIKYICGLIDVKEYKNTRGEFLFNSMDITYLDVVRNKNCKICGDINYE